MVPCTRFHTTGLEGSTLTPPETLLTVAGKPLLAGFDERERACSRRRRRGTIECCATLGRARPRITTRARGTAAGHCERRAVGARVHELGRNTRQGRPIRPPSVRRVGIGHKRVLLPMPDELPALVRDMFEWLAVALLRAGPVFVLGLDGGGGGAPVAPEAWRRALDLACDLHTRFVFIHPFADGNGRVARTLAGIFCSGLGSPRRCSRGPCGASTWRPLSLATIDRNYSTLAEIHAAAVRRLLACIIALAEADGTMARHADAVVRGVVDSECNMAGM